METDPAQSNPQASSHMTGVVERNIKAIFLSTFVLISQNRMAALADEPVELLVPPRLVAGGASILLFGNIICQ